MKQTILIIAVLFLTLSGSAQKITVAAAANLRLVLDEIKSDYLKLNPEVQLDINYGASGSLTQQIMNGAGFDIFMSADQTFPEKLKNQGMVSGEMKTYAIGKLVLWSNTLDVSKGLGILTDKSVRRISIAKPEIATYGDRAVKCLKYYKLYDQLKEKIIYADNISQAAQFVQTGNAEVGFLAYALVLAPEMKGTYFELDPKSFPPVEQALVLIKKRETNPKAIGFMNYVLSAKSKPIFEKYGYLVP